MVEYSFADLNAQVAAEQAAQQQTAAPEAPQAAAQPEGGAPTPTAPAAPTASEFAVPDEYRDAGWTQGLKSYEDLWKKTANAQQLIGKKSVPANVNEMDAEQLSEYYNGIRPESHTDYALPEGMEAENAEFYQQLMHEQGLTKAQGEAIFSKFNEQMAAQMEAATSEDGYKDMLQEKFGKDYEKTAGDLYDLLKKHVPQEVHERIFADGAKGFTNQQLGDVYEIANALSKAFGATEGVSSESGSSNGMSMPAPTSRSPQEIIRDIQNLSHSQHNDADKQRLQQELQQAYVRKGLMQ